MEKIINYLKETYRPTAIVVYGSYADGTNDATSDFDALVLGPTCPHTHDGSVVDGVTLDVFVYPRDIFYGEIVIDEFAQLQDGKVVLDEDGMGTWLKNRVCDYIANMPKKDREEVRAAVEWCEKMLSRAARGDAEGYFRWHWLLIDSLEIYCDACGRPFVGPKKTISDMRKKDPEALDIYNSALRALDYPALEAWVALLRRRFEEG